MAQKTTTTTTQVRTTPTPTFSYSQPNPVRQGYTVNHAAIQAGTNAGQRGATVRPPVVAVPPVLHSTSIPTSSNTFLSNISMPAMVPCPQTGPHLSVPGISAPPSTTPGYSVAHRTYLVKQNAQARRVSIPKPSGHVLSLKECYTLRYSVKCQYGGRASAKVVFNIQSNGIRDVDAHSTGPQLQHIISTALAIPWGEATYDYPLSDDMWTLQNKSDVDIVAAFPVLPAFYSGCMSTPASGKARFVSGRTMDAVVMLTAAAHSDVEAHIEEVSALSPTSLVRSPPAKRVSSTSSASSVPWDQLLEAIDPVKLGDALRKHGSRLFTTEFFPLLDLPIGELLERNLADELSNSQLALAGVISLNIHLDNELGTGSFKKCVLGSLVLHTTPATGLGSAGSQSVALKRPYFKDDSSAQRGKRFPSAEELCFVTKEAILWQWGSSLLALVLAFVKNHVLADQEGAPAIPLVRFVQAGVAKIISANAGDAALAGAMLVEEQIPPNQAFTRFIGNGSAIPYPFPDSTYEYTLAQFCSFCQHVQWVLTGGQVFCADWQGGSSGSMNIESLLTDPQIMTNPYCIG
ncbi:hypothetical protein FRC07_015062 [Ceratobasidium sp. 392]|nr:hypothetical protein FRC07_015062 [Ceratobasidium sp. 392]